MTEPQAMYLGWEYQKQIAEIEGAAMIFEIGKTYKHSTSKKMTIVGEADTKAYGHCLVGETEDGELQPVGILEENAEGLEIVE